MIFRRYGTSYHSVELNFDSKALTEIGFRRDRQESIPVEVYETEYEELEIQEMAPSDEGSVQDETEQVLLDHVERDIRAMEAQLAEGEVLVVLNEQGVDWPKTRHSSKVIVEGVENRLHFTAWVEPPLRLARVRKR